MIFNALTQNFNMYKKLSYVWTCSFLDYENRQAHRQKCWSQYFTPLPEAKWLLYGKPIHHTDDIKVRRYAHL